MKVTPLDAYGFGDDSSGVETQCDIVYCAVDQRVNASNTCLACDVGRGRPAYAVRGRGAD